MGIPLPAQLQEERVIEETIALSDPGAFELYSFMFGLDKFQSLQNPRRNLFT